MSDELTESQIAAINQAVTAALAENKPPAETKPAELAGAPQIIVVPMPQQSAPPETAPDTTVSEPPPETTPPETTPPEAPPVPAVDEPPKARGFWYRPFRDLLGGAQ